MSHSGEYSNKQRTQKDLVSPNKYGKQTRVNKLKQIDDIYKSQIEQIYGNKNNFKTLIDKNQDKDEKTSFSRKAFQVRSKNIKFGTTKTEDFENISTSSRVLNSVVSQQKIKSTRFINADSSKTIDLLKLQNQNKDRKIRDLTNKCEYLLEKLRAHISVNQFSQELQALTKLAENKIQRFQNLFKIKNQQNFFKIRLQITSLLHQFDIPKEQINTINDIQTESSLFSFMSKKIKNQIKKFRIRQQDNNFQIQKDKILNQKIQERLTYLTETNELLKITQQKLKQKNSVLKSQLHQFLEKLKQKQIRLQQSDSELFRMKRQNQQILSNSNKNQHLQKKFKQEHQSFLQKFQLKEKELKNTINSQNIEKKKLQSQLEEKDCLISEMQIKQKYLSQQNQRINRQLIRVKQRYQWCEKEIQNKNKQFEEQRIFLIEEFKQYKESNNDSLLLIAKAQTQQAMRKIQQYQQAYSRLSLQFEEERKISQLKSQQNLRKIEAVEQSWLEKTKRLQQIRQQQLQQLSKQYEQKHQQLRRDFQRKQKLIAEQMHAKMKALLAQKDKKITQKFMKIQQQNQQLKRQLDIQKQ